MLTIAGLSQAKGRGSELNLGLPRGPQGPSNRYLPGYKQQTRGEEGLGFGTGVLICDVTQAGTQRMCRVPAAISAVLHVQLNSREVTKSTGLRAEPEL